MGVKCGFRSFPEACRKRLLGLVAVMAENPTIRFARCLFVLAESGFLEYTGRNDYCCYKLGGWVWRGHRVGICEPHLLICASCDFKATSFFTKNVRVRWYLHHDDLIYCPLCIPDVEVHNRATACRGWRLTLDKRVR
jgi:hypothetical protein